VREPLKNVPLADIGKTTSIFGVGGRGLQPQLADAVVEYLLSCSRRLVTLPGLAARKDDAAQQFYRQKRVTRVAAGARK
jgi:hypothetical protein